MWIGIDIETYKEFDGSKECEEEIVRQMLTPEDKRKFIKEKKKGMFYPILNSREFTLGCAITETGEKVLFENYKHMWNWLVKKISENAMMGKRTFIYGHNIEYDFYGIAKDEFLNEDLKVICYMPFFATWFCKGMRQQKPKVFEHCNSKNKERVAIKEKEVKDNWGYFLDTWGFFRMPLKQVGEILGHSKLEMPFAVKDKAEMVQYLERDTELVLKAMGIIKENMKQLGFTPRKFLTAGQVAITTYLSYIRKKNIHYNMMRSGEVFKGENLEKCRPAYRGGRCEAFRDGYFKKVTHLDINSLYPYAMANMPFPKLNEELFLEEPLKDLTLDEVLAEKFIGVAECQIKVPKIEIGYLPVRWKKSLYFPISNDVHERKITGTWTTLELREARKLGYEILRMNWCCLYPVMGLNLFKDYVNELYDLRLKSDPHMKVVIKLIMNNLYGKFAQFRTNKDFKAIERWKLTKFKKLGWRKKSDWLNKYIIVKDNEVYTPKYTNLMLAILTTAYARDYLYKFLSKIPKKDLLYCDTDSCIFTGEHKHKFKISEKMGEWKVEHENEDCRIIGEKRYRVGDDKHISGVSRLLIKKELFEEKGVVQIKRKISLKDGFNDPHMYLRRVGEFKNVDVKLVGGTKQNVLLPDNIDERREWINIFE